MTETQQHRMAGRIQVMIQNLERFAEDTAKQPEDNEAHCSLWSAKCSLDRAMAALGYDWDYE